MPRDYLHEGDYRLAVELRVIGRELQEPNRSYALGYKRFLELNNRKPKTIARRLQELRSILKEFRKDAKAATRENIEAIAIWINGSTRASISKDKLRLTLKNFYKWLYQSEEYPDLVKWIKLSNDGSNRLPAEVLLTEEDIVRLIGVCKNQRDKALIALLWDTGMRVGELLNLKIQDLTFQQEGASYVRISGKTGDRRTPVIFSTPYLVNYVNDLRAQSRQTDPLFVIIDHGAVTEKPVDYPSVRKILKQLRARSGLDKRIYPHLFRHSRATFYANDLTEQQLKMFFGWTGSSNMASVYVHLSGRDIDNAVLKANGIMSARGETAKPKLTVKSCPKCHDPNAMTDKYCRKCGSPLDIGPMEQSNELESVRQKLDDMTRAVNLLIEKIDPQSRDAIMGVLKNR
jgi:integrase/recombinase XerD